MEFIHGIYEFATSRARHLEDSIAGICVLALLTTVVFFWALYNAKGSSIEFLSNGVDEKQLELSIANGKLSTGQLRLFDGELREPIYLSIDRMIFDVSSAPEFYGKGSPYHVYAGRESGRALGKMTLRTPQHDDDLANPWVDDLDEEQIKVRQDWKDKLQKKYPVVGVLIRDTLKVKKEI